MNSRHRTLTPFFALIALLLMAPIGCGGSGKGDAQSEPPARYTIATTTGMITDIVRQVAGEHASVVGLINSGVDPHLYQPTRDDILQLTQADVVFYNGLLLEGKMISTFERVAQNGTMVVAVSEDLDESALRSPSEYSDHHDPHVWMDPVAWCSGVEVVAWTLSAFDPANASAYEANARALIARIMDLHARAEVALGTIPESQRVLVTAHDAFGYFGQRYGFEVVGIQGISTESEAGVRDIERIVDLLVDRQVRAVFVETTVSERNIRALIAGANSRGHRVVVGGSLYSDAMGPADTYEGTYVGMIDHNITQIARALGGEAPERGFFGTLTAEPQP